MGYFKNIQLDNFRNFDSFNLKFSKKCNIFYGKNGSGKTNILEAISLFSKGRGFRKDKITNIIKKNCDNFITKSTFEDKNIIYNLISQSQLKNNNIVKKISINDDTSKESLTKLNSLLSFLFFLPETERLFLSSPSTRRNFIDRFIFSHQESYNKLINQYDKNLTERSKILKEKNYDTNWLKRIENNISEYGLQIYKHRHNQVSKLIDYLNIFLIKFSLPYSVSVELLDNFYNSQPNKDIYESELKNNRNLDSLLGGSKIGPQKSDYLFYVNNSQKVSQLSTGQQKTLILLIFLSQCQYLIDTFDKKPILLLDEVCSHLDDTNRNILLTLIESLDLQIFMTGTTKDLFSFLSTNTNFYNITN